MINFLGILDYCIVFVIFFFFVVILFIVDFERGIWKGIREVFLGV